MHFKVNTMSNPYNTKLVVYAVIKTPDNKDKVIAVYARQDPEDPDHSRSIVKSMQDKNKGVKLFGEMVSRWHIS